jgi:hypothetical protein
MIRPWPTGGCRDIEKIINTNDKNKYYKTDLGNLISYEKEVDIDNKLFENNNHYKQYV